MIALSGVAVERDGRRLLDGVDLALGAGRVALLGANGSGKSTLLRLLNGLARPSAGTVTVDGLDTVRDGAAVRARVGFVFQDPAAQLVLPTVAEDVALALGRRREADPRVRAVLARFGVEHLHDRAVHGLSGGEQQLVALCGVLVAEPAYVVLDEPTTHLDLRHATRIRAVIAGLPVPVVVATHDLELAAACDRAVVLERGRVTFDGPPGDGVAYYREAGAWAA